MTALSVFVIGLIIVLIILALATAAVAASYNQIFSEFEKNRKKLAKYEAGMEVTKDAVEEERLMLKQKFEAVMVGEAEEFREMLSYIKMEGLKLLKDMSDLERSDAQKALSQFRDMLANVAKEEVQRVKQESDNYIAEKMQEVDAKAVSVLQSVAEEVIPQSIDMEKKKELIIAALEKAKKDNMFGI